MSIATANGFQVYRLRNLKHDRTKVTIYTGVYLTSGAAGVERTLRQLDACGYLKHDGDGDVFMIDLIDDEGDLIDDRPLAKGGYEYLKWAYKFKVDRTEILGD